MGIVFGNNNIGEKVQVKNNFGVLVFQENGCSGVCTREGIT